MKVIASLAVLALATPALSQTPPASTSQPPASSSVTRDLNSGPPVAATYLAPPPAAPVPVATAASPASRPAIVPMTSPARPPVPTVVPAATSVPAVASPAPATVSTAPAPAPHPTATAPVPAPAEAATDAAPAPPPPSYTLLDAPARAALPFTVNLPAGFEIAAERSGPSFKMYSVRRPGQPPFVMIYAGPTSQFPIYDGEMVEAGGRASIVSTEDGQRHAKEHLFQRATDPREVHIWVSSLEGADRTLAETIAQSVDVR